MTEDRNRALARMHLDLAHALFERREDLRLSLAELSQATGLETERLEMIEEGDTTSLTEIAQLCAALDVTLTLSEGLGITLESEPRVRWIHGQTPEPFPIRPSEPKISVGTKERQ